MIITDLMINITSTKRGRRGGRGGEGGGLTSRTRRVGCRGLVFVGYASRYGGRRRWCALCPAASGSGHPASLAQTRGSLHALSTAATTRSITFPPFLCLLGRPRMLCRIKSRCCCPASARARVITSLSFSSSSPSSLERDGMSVTVRTPNMPDTQHSPTPSSASSIRRVRSEQRRQQHIFYALGCMRMYV
jgi:hypothetical protein